MELSSRDRTVGATLVVAGVLFQALWLGRAAALLSVALAAAWIVWSAGGWTLANRALARTFAVAIVIFVLHVGEEYLTGFQRRFPALVGAHWTDARFLVFNAAWGVAFIGAAWALPRRRPLAALIVLFFAIGGGLGNGIGHLLLVALAGGYFPGAWTAVLCLVVGVALLREMFDAAKV